MRVKVKISTYPLLLDELLQSTMFPVMTTSPLNLLLHAAQLPASHIASQYVTDYHSVALMRRKVPQLTFHLLTQCTTTEPHGFCTATAPQVYLYHV